MPHRPWNTVEEMNEGLINNWNKTVTTRDTVIILGDLIMGKKSENVPKYLPRLNGTLCLVTGNHDFLPSEIKKPEKLKWYEDLYLNNGISQLMYGTVSLSTITNDTAHNKIFLSHFPPKSIDDHYEGREEKYRHLQYDLQEDEYLLHGHNHSRQHLTLKNAYHVGVDAEIHNYSPVSLDLILSRLGIS
jgi:calcineurin-like phosphoesterase family protein